MEVAEPISLLMDELHFVVEALGDAVAASKAPHGDEFFGPGGEGLAALDPLSQSGLAQLINGAQEARTSCPHCLRVRCFFSSRLPRRSSHVSSRNRTGREVPAVHAGRGRTLRVRVWRAIRRLLNYLLLIVGVEIARCSVESQRPSELIHYATATPFAIDFLETALAIEDNSSGICRWPMTLRNCRSATSSPEPTQRSI